MFTTLFYQPLYNGLISLITLLPWLDLGMAVIVFTCVVKLILFPLSRQSVKTQIRMKEIAPLVDDIKKQYKDNKEEQARRMMAIYKEKGINPLSGVFLILLQLPIIFALYRVFYSSGLPNINTDLLYSFFTAPHALDVHFLGLFDITKRSFFVAALAGISQFFQVRFLMPAQAEKKENPTFQENLSRNMSLQMKYGMPVIVFLISSGLSAAIGLYWITSNLFAIGQEIYLRKKLKQPKTNS